MSGDDFGAEAIITLVFFGVAGIVIGALLTVFDLCRERDSAVRCSPLPSVTYFRDNGKTIAVCRDIDGGRTLREVTP